MLYDHCFSVSAATFLLAVPCQKPDYDDLNYVTWCIVQLEPSSMDPHSMYFTLNSDPSVWNLQLELRLIKAGNIFSLPSYCPVKLSQCEPLPQFWFPADRSATRWVLYLCRPSASRFPSVRDWICSSGLWWVVVRGAVAFLSSELPWSFCSDSWNQGAAAAHWKISFFLTFRC